ncbi:hypothetical protein EVAR_97632_1 [Eumeta japonica]|uniref:Uncharacterized protein n=1 Tax=Eumeta variegata TaxID=151549 RepID=A0A4C2AD89_EUMVA|nr:hypothetical protein EVAR_97632_1 [Eumeta japonica]
MAKDVRSSDYHGESHTDSVDQFQSFYFHFLAESHQMLAEEIRVEERKTDKNNLNCNLPCENRKAARVSWCRSGRMSSWSPAPVQHPAATASNATPTGSTTTAFSDSLSTHFTILHRVRPDGTCECRRRVTCAMDDAWWKSSRHRMSQETVTGRFLPPARPEAVSGGRVE